MRGQYIIACLALFIVSCSFPQRTGYNRKTGSYNKPHSLVQKSSTVNTSKSRTNSTITSSNSTSTRSDLMGVIKPWMGTRYLYGGSSKSGTDCSGYVMNIYKDWKGLSLPHSTRESWKMGKSVLKMQLKQGDVVFFGNLFGVNHNGIYLGNGNFTHASTSQGVTITPLDDPYWSKRYKGARRYF